ncbi:MAG: DUF4160 domain-containing protein [Candidatus Marinimicrobia bacterium]|jgi:hypothetical protein|nr:DUF4160 domain-containing protein [Candidatus Neomarinimicrobiota bacterium]
MPIISRFLGIIVTMYWDDHAPPHFHAKYAEYEVSVNIYTGVIEGKFPRRALHHVMEWYEIHKDELVEDWELCQNGEAPNQIEPLE